LRERPFERYKRLKPWLELGDLAARTLDGRSDPSTTDETMGPVLRLISGAPVTPSFPAGEMRLWVEQSTDKIEARKKLFRLAQDVARAFLYCLGEEPEGFAFEDGPRPGKCLIKKNGLIDVDTFDPYQENFLPVIKGVEIERIRRCPICGKIFFALRTKTKGGKDTSSKACSRKCNQLRRVREWRANQTVYLLNRKLRPERGK
jgi:hypothetical protein